MGVNLGNVLANAGKQAATDFVNGAINGATAGTATGSAAEQVAKINSDSLNDNLAMQKEIMKGNHQSELHASIAAAEKNKHDLLMQIASKIG